MSDELRSLRGWRRGAVTATALVALAPAVSPAAIGQEPADSSATLRGEVVSAMTGGPLHDVHVSLANAGRGVFTDSAGRFVLAGVPAGRDTVSVRQVGFADESVPLELRPGRVTRATLMLSETVLRVEDITVTVDDPAETGRLVGFEERRRKGHGYFLGPEEIDDRIITRPSDLLRRAPGVRVGPSGTGRRTSITIGRSQRRCEPAMWVDGQPIRDFHVDDLAPSDLLAIEVYRGAAEIPSEFMRREGQCAVLVVWTREGTRDLDDER